MLNVDVQLRLLKYKEDTTKLLEDAENIEYIVAKLIDDIRNMSVELRTASLDDLGLEAAFKSYFKQFEENYGIKMHIKQRFNVIQDSTKQKKVVMDQLKLKILH